MQDDPQHHTVSGIMLRAMDLDMDLQYEGCHIIFQDYILCYSVLPIKLVWGEIN